MTTPVKFLFGEDFEQDEKAEEEAAQKLVLEELRADFNAELIQEKQKSYDEGFQAGQLKQQEANEVALKKSNEDLQKTLEVLDQHISELVGNSEQMRVNFEERLTEYRNQSVRLALDAAEKIAGTLIEERPIENLEQAFREILNFIETELRVSVFLPEELLKEAEPRVLKVVAEQGHQGRVNLLSDNSLKKGDWKIEWGAGGVIHNRDHVVTLLEDALQRYITGVEVTLSTDENSVVEEAPLQEAGNSGQGEDT